MKPKDELMQKVMALGRTQASFLVNIMQLSRLVRELSDEEKEEFYREAEKILRN